MSEDKKWSKNEISSDGKLECFEEDKVSPPCPPVEIKVKKDREAVDQPRNLLQALVRSVFYSPFSVEFAGTLINTLATFFGIEIPDDIYDDFIWLEDMIVNLPKIKQDTEGAYKEIFDRYPHSRKTEIKHNTDHIKDEMKIKKKVLHRKLSSFVYDQLKRKGMSEEDFARIWGFGGKS